MDVGNAAKHLIVAPINLIVKNYTSDVKSQFDTSKYTMYVAIVQKQDTLSYIIWAKSDLNSYIILSAVLILSIILTSFCIF